ncbi:protein PvdJ(3) [Pseudomonas aeruginosa PA38182]|nr:protein PvdJ(3) [Pseudomonas aeruginosa PA38182]
MYNHQNAGQGKALELPGLRVEALERASATAQFDLTLDTYESGDALSASLIYATSLFERSTVERLAAHWRNLLEAICQDASQRVGELPMLAEAEYVELVRGCESAPCAEPACLHPLVDHALSCDNEPKDMDEVWRLWSNPSVRMQLQGHVSLLHCTSQYPTPPDEVNLLAMDTLRSFGLAVGYSDHTEGGLVPIAAVARGACIIEKHFTLDRSMPGPDHKASLEPGELAQMVAQIRMLEVALGSPYKAPQPSEWDTRQAARQQVVAARDIEAGMIITRDDLTTARSGHGLPPTSLWELVGSTSKRAFLAGETLEK